MREIILKVSLVVCAFAALSASAQQPIEGDYVIHDFRFASGAVLPALRLHYTTLGQPQRDASGRVDNAVLILHGTGGRGANFLREDWMAELFGPGQPLDAARYFIILPDSIGHGGSSKPSDGLHAQFPRYDYADMVRAQYRMMTEALGVDHLRLIIGTSMGGMHAWLWAVTYPDAMDAVVPMVCLPVEVSGRNRMLRRIITDAVRRDPAWNGGEYAAPPPGLRTALQLVLISGASARELSQLGPTTIAADRFLEDFARRRLPQTDANDFLYAWESSTDYDPSAQLPQIRARVLAINFEDDERNPPELGIMEREIARVPHGRYVLIPASDSTHGHRSFYQVSLWKQHLIELLAK
jgi:homoserine O-acetyltransferase/O-succinyltransferase